MSLPTWAELLPLWQVLNLLSFALGAGKEWIHALATRSAAITFQSALMLVVRSNHRDNVKKSSAAGGFSPGTAKGMAKSQCVVSGERNSYDFRGIADASSKDPNQLSMSDSAIMHQLRRRPES